MFHPRRLQSPLPALLGRLAVPGRFVLPGILGTFGLPALPVLAFLFFLGLRGAPLLPQEDPSPKDEPAPQNEPPPAGREERAGPEDAVKPDLPSREPAFKKDSAKEDFEKGKSLFNEGSFKEAEALFKKVKADAKEKEDKDTVESWLQAAGGAQLLERVKARAKQGQIQQAYQEADVYLRKYRGTPAEAGFKKLLGELEERLYVVIEDFNTPTVEYAAKFGKTFPDDPRLYLDGTRCLRWTNTQDRKQGMLKVRNVPQDWSKFEALEFWWNVTAAPSAPEAVIMCPDAEAAKKKAPSKAKKKGAAEPPTEFLMAPVRLPAQAGWQKVRILLSEFRAQGNATLSSVSDFRIQVGAGKAFDLLIDKIALLKKNPGAPEPKGRKPKS